MPPNTTSGAFIYLFWQTENFVFLWVGGGAGARRGGVGWGGWVFDFGGWGGVYKVSGCHGLGVRQQDVRRYDCAVLRGQSFRVSGLQRLGFKV
jgi:hypothetical protein